MRIQMMENLNFAFTYLQNRGVNLTNIGSSDILDGNQKLILGLMWTLIKSFTVAEIDVEGVSGKDGLLLWVNRSLADYKTVDVRNFSSSWSDGMAFCALIHRFYPSAIDFDKLQPSNATENVTLAFKVAEERFKVPQLLNVADVAGHAKPDEKSIMTYVSMLFKEFASGVQKKKAVTTIAKAVNIAQRHQELSKEYMNSASGLLEWLTQQADRFQTLSQPRRMLDIKAALAAHLEYKRNEKPPREAEFVAVEGCAGRWIASCKNNNREIPVLSPPIEKLQEVKAKVDDLEIQYELKLRQNLETFQKTEVYLTKVVKELEKVEAWAKDKESLMLDDDSLKTMSTSEAEEKLDSIGFIEEIEVPRYKQLLAAVVEDAKDLSSEHSETTSTLERIESMKQFVANIENKMLEAKARFEEALKAQLEVDAVVKDCKLLMRNLKYVIEEMDEEVEVATNVESVNKSGVAAAKIHFDQVLVPKVEEAVVSENAKLIEKKAILEAAGRVSDVALIEKTNARVQRLLSSLDEKREFFETELANVAIRDEVCKEFAALSIRIKERCVKSTQLINAVEGSLGDQYKSMQVLRQKLFRQNTTGIIIEEPVKETEREADGVEANNVVEETREQMMTSLTEDIEKLEKLSEELERLRVYSNPFTTDTIHGLRAQYSSLETAVRDKVKSLEKEVALSKLGNLTPDQLKEIKEVFDHFDLDNDGVLARDEFIMACKGMGLSLSEDDCHDSFDKLDENDNDELSFEAFSNFCAEQLQSGSSKDDVLTAFEVLTTENLTLEKIEEQFEPPLVEFIKKNMSAITLEDGETIDYEKFTKFIFSL